MSALKKPIVRCLRSYWHQHFCQQRMLRAVVIAVAVLFAASPVSAREITTDQAVERARQQVPGKLVAVNKEQQGGQAVYRVRILGSDGVVRTVYVNANP